jgi:hypothetical protein
MLITNIYYLFSFLFLVGLGYELRALHLQSSHTSSLFYSSHFGDGVL